jgi:hypothetical protein
MIQQIPVSDSKPTTRPAGNNPAGSSPMPAAGHPKALVPYLETFIGVVEGGTTAEVFAFWLRTLRTELETITDPQIRAEGMRLFQEIDKVGYWFAHEARRPGEALPMILSPIRKLMDYLQNAVPAA